MFCKYCGAFLDDDAVFCEKCGKPVVGRPLEAVIQKNEEGTGPQDSHNNENSEVKALTNLYGDDHSDGIVKETEIAADQKSDAAGENEAVGKMAAVDKKKKGLPAVGIIALVLIAVIGLAGLSRHSGSTGTRSKAPDVMAQNNFENGGIFAYDDTRHYFIGPYEKKDQESVLYSTDREGNDRKKLSSEKEYDKIKVTGEQLLVSICDSDADRYELQMMNKDGSDVKTIVKSSSRLEGFDRSGKIIFYLADNKIHSCSIDGENDEVIVEGALSFICAGDVLYYTTDTSANSYDFEKKEDTTLVDGTVSYLCYENEKLYYVKNDAVYEMNLKGNEEKKLADVDTVTSLLVLDDMILALHMLSYEEIGELLKKADMEDYIIEAIGTGYLVQIPKEGGSAFEAKNAYGGVALFGCPEDMYCRVSFFSNDMISIKEIVQKMK